MENTNLLTIIQEEILPIKREIETLNDRMDDIDSNINFRIKSLEERMDKITDVLNSVVMALKRK